MEKWLHDGQELDYPRRSLHPLQLITEMQVCKPGAAEWGIGQDSAVNVAEEIYAASGSVSWDWSDLGQHRPFLLFDFGNEDLINLGEAGQIIKASLKGAARCVRDFRFMYRQEISSKVYANMLGYWFI